MACLCIDAVMAIARRPLLGFLLPVAASLLSCATPHTASLEAVPRLTLAELAAQPAKWHNKRVEVSGVASSRSEHNRLYGSIYDLCVPTEAPTYIVSDYKSADLPVAYDRNGIFRGRFIARDNRPSAREAEKNVSGRLQGAQLVDWTSDFIPACF